MLINKNQEAVQMYDDIIKAPRDIFIDRTVKYGDSWKQLHVSSCIDLMMMKLDRMRSNNIGYKMEDELADILNYSVILIALFNRDTKEVIK